VALEAGMVDQGLLINCGRSGPACLSVASPETAIPLDDIILDLHNSCRPWKSKKIVCHEIILAIPKFFR